MGVIVPRAPGLIPHRAPAEALLLGSCGGPYALGGHARALIKAPASTLIMTPRAPTGAL